MNLALKGLLFKEWKMMKGFFIGQFVIGLIMLLLLDAVNQGSMTEIVVGLMGFGFIVLPASMLFSLNSEVNQMQIFLHNSQSVHLMLLVKFMNGLFFAFCFSFIMTLAAACIDLIWNTSTMTSFDVFIFLLYTIPQILIIPLYPTVLLLFYWTLHQVWRTYIAGISIIVVVFLLIVGNRVMNFFQQTDMYTTLTKWGQIVIPTDKFQELPLIFVESNGITSSIFVGTYVFYGIITVILYLISAYLLDHKVEV